VASGVGLVIDDDDGEGFAAQQGDLVDAAVDVDRVDAAYLADAARCGVQVVVEHGPGQFRVNYARVAGSRTAACGSNPGSGGRRGPGCATR
jgi:hypothetical protein